LMAMGLSVCLAHAAGTALLRQLDATKRARLATGGTGAASDTSEGNATPAAGADCACGWFGCETLITEGARLRCILGRL